MLILKLLVDKEINLTYIAIVIVGGLIYSVLMKKIVKKRTEKMTNKGFPRT
jgi:hypothetical protein